MDKSYFSPNWHRVANLRLRLRNHTAFHRMHFRGQLWYVLQDRTSGRFHRFAPASYLLVSLLDGRRTVQEIWDEASARVGDDALTQDEVIRLLGQLHAADVLLGDVPPDIAELDERGTKQRRRKRLMSLMNPLALRFPLIDPNEFLTATAPIGRAVFSILGAVVFLCVLAYGLLLAAQHWSELTDNVADRVLATENLILLLIAYPFVKALHELGHAYAVKRWGGEVHEMGLMLLVFMPVPYVDASDAMAFRSKWQRALVGSAGILVEVFLAAIAMIIWAQAEEGLMRALAFSVMLIGGVSTLLFNGNPLLRFDGYYVLSDILEIPNLGNRANAYWAWLVKKKLFGIESAPSPVTARGEAPWLFTYALAAFLYRLFIVAVIASFVATRFFVIGVLIAIWAVVLMLGVPIFKSLKFLFTSPALRHRRGRAFAITGGTMAAVLAAVTLVPLPHSTMAEGVLVAPGESTVHAGADGIVIELLARPNSWVSAGEPLLQLRDSALEARVAILQARVAELSQRHAMRDLADQSAARITLEELRLAQADLAVARERQEALVIKARSAGRVLLDRPEDLVGRYLRRGEIIGQVARLDNPVIRVVVVEDDADLVLQRTQELSLRLASAPAEVHAVEVLRIAPAFEARVPSPALTTSGGGRAILDPTDPQRVRTIERYLHLELRLETGAPPRIGERVHVRFRHDDQALLPRLHRLARQAFLRHFDV